MIQSSARLLSDAATVCHEFNAVERLESWKRGDGKKPHQPADGIKARKFNIQN